MKTKVHEFDPVLYPVMLWILIAGDSDYLRSRFLCYPSRKNLPVEIPKDTDAIVDTVILKRNNKIGILITFRDLEACTTRTIVHEACHVADRIWKRIGEQKKGSEANAYLVEWIVECAEECIEKVKLNKL